MRIQDLLEAYDHGRTLFSFRDRLASALKKDRYPKYRDMDPEDALSWQRSSRTDTRSISSRTRRKRCSSQRSRMTDTRSSTSRTHRKRCSWQRSSRTDLRFSTFEKPSKHVLKITLDDRQEHTLVRFQTLSIIVFYKNFWIRNSEEECLALNQEVEISKFSGSSKCTANVES